MLALIDVYIGQLWEVPGHAIRYSFWLIAYPILAYQLATGFPPFYASNAWRESQEQFGDLIWRNRIFILVLILFAYIAGLVGIRGHLLLIGPMAIFVGWRIRTNLAASTDGPLGIFLGRVSFGRPMLIFDIWTIGLTILVFVILTMA
jgi:hypothetical protein